MEKRRRIRGPIILSGEALEPQQKAAKQSESQIEDRRDSFDLLPLSIVGGVRTVRMMRGVVRNVRQIVSTVPF